MGKGADIEPGHAVNKADKNGMRKDSEKEGVYAAKKLIDMLFGMVGVMR